MPELAPPPESLARPDLVCSGSPYELGLAQGRALAAHIKATRKDLSKLELFRLSQPWWLPYGVYRGLAERRARKLLERPLRRDHPKGAERLSGIAAGAGLTLDSVILLNAFESFMSAARERCTLPSPAACSAIALRGARTESGEPVITRLFDYIPLAQPYFTVRETRPEGGFRSLDFTVAPLAGAVDGINERGLAITYNYAYTQDEGRPTGPISLAISEALERCGTVAEAASLISSRGRWGGGILMLADAGGDIASLELSSTAAKLRRPADGEDAIFHTNAFSTSEMRAVELPAGAVFDARAPRALRGRRVHESAERRSARIRELFADPARLGPGEILSRMADHGKEGKPADTTVCVHGSFWHTTAVLQYFPRSRRMRASFTTACAPKFRDLAL
ncbi:MAG: hypothetical protein HY925_08305 [Elusimicrobia bacterium]|nr:hypothetical protein [Elusimicrobiota bacterium]